MKRASFFLPDDLRDRLAAESQRSGVPVAELVRRSLDATVPPITVGFGELRRFLDRQGFLKVLVLSAREGKLLVEPDNYEGRIQFWVDASLVSFPEPPKPIPAPLLSQPIRETPLDLRLNMQADPELTSPKPTTCGICGEPFPSRAAKRRHVRDAHSAPPTTVLVSKPEEPK